jgi:hypothetical protein
MTDEAEEVVYRVYEAGKPFPKTNKVWGGDDREPMKGWQKVPGCCRIVHEAIPDPLPFYAPAWCGWRGVPTKSGVVYDYETGREMRDYRSVIPAGPKVRLDMRKAKERK